MRVITLALLIMANITNNWIFAATRGLQAVDLQAVDPRAADLKAIIHSLDSKRLQEHLLFQQQDRVLKKQCEIELELLYPPVSCLERIDKLRQKYKKNSLFSKKNGEYKKLCLRRVRQMRSLRWIEKALGQHVGGICAKALTHQKRILKYRAIP